MRIIFHRKQAAVRSQLTRLGVKSHKAAAFAAGDIFYAVKAEADHIAKAADLAAIVLAAKSMRGVFYHAQPLAPGKIVHFAEMPGVAGIVHIHEGNGIGSKAFFSVGQIEGAGFCQHVAGHGNAARSGDGLKGRHKCQGRHKNFGFSGHAALGGHGIHSQMQGCCARVGCDDLLWLYTKILGQFFFKKTHFIAHTKIAVLKKNTADGTGFCFAHNGT